MSSNIGGPAAQFWPLPSPLQVEFGFLEIAEQPLMDL